MLTRAVPLPADAVSWHPSGSGSSGGPGYYACHPEVVSGNSEPESLSQLAHLQLAAQLVRSAQEGFLCQHYRWLSGLPDWQLSQCSAPSDGTAVPVTVGAVEMLWRVLLGVLYSALCCGVLNEQRKSCNSGRPWNLLLCCTVCYTQVHP